MAGPLAGVKVVELASIGPIPFCGMVLSDMGCDVVRVDLSTGAAMEPASACTSVFAAATSRALALSPAA